MKQKISKTIGSIALSTAALAGMAGVTFYAIKNPELMEAASKQYDSALTRAHPESKTQIQELDIDRAPAIDNIDVNGDGYNDYFDSEKGFVTKVNPETGAVTKQKYELKQGPFEVAYYSEDEQHVVPALPTIMPNSRMTIEAYEGPTQ